ncbi:hypothetical protein U9M48_001550 [Paspalum notatum var. saurae]|uniref:Transposase-associated domain-containing protein n=1 Tax=Paspalum notatum var. saurae TaxID=547442 RepID=A0AAQ3PG11_PASNO
MDSGFIRCPCVDYKNQKEYSSSRDIQIHLMKRGFVPNYVCWTKHGESGVMLEDDEEEFHNIDYAEHPFFADTTMGAAEDVEDVEDTDALGEMLQVAEKYCDNENNKENTKIVRWHKEDRKEDDMLRHPADGSQWREVDRMYPEFAKHARNIRWFTWEIVDSLADHRNRTIHRDGKVVFQMVKNLRVVFGKGSGSQPVPNEDGKAPMWKKKSIFWDLPYWEVLDVCHAIDVMHLTKSLCMN